jgi:hypothetical protein
VLKARKSAASRRLSSQSPPRYQASGEVLDMPLTEDAKEVGRRYKTYLMVVGDIATRYAAFEHVINAAIWTLCGVDQRTGSCVTSEIISIGSRFRILIALMHEKGCDQRLVERAIELSKSADKTSKFRNKYIHAPIDLGLADGELVPVVKHVRIERKLKDEWEPYDFDEMNKTSARCQELAAEASALRADIQLHLGLKG